MIKNLFIGFLIAIALVVCSSFLGVEEETTKKKFVIVLDAGHGGKDPGRPTKYGYKEKDIALKIVLLIGKQLEKNPNIKVIYTRKTDVFLELRERARIANKADADLFVSIHCNAHNTQASGTETFVVGATNSERNLNIAKEENEVIFLEDNHEEHYEGFDPNSPESLIGMTLMQEEYTEQSILLANLVQENFAKKLKRKNRGVKQASLWVMHNTYMPSVLIETGFITNLKEGKYLNSKNGQVALANSIATSILQYKSKLVGEEETPIKTVKAKDIIFKVQLAASSRSLELKSYNFNGLKDLSKEKAGKIYRYFTGKTNSYSKIKTVLQEAKKKKYKDAYIVAYKNGKKIPVAEAIK